MTTDVAAILLLLLYLQKRQHVSWVLSDYRRGLTTYALSKYSPCKVGSCRRLQLGRRETTLSHLLPTVHMSEGGINSIHLMQHSKQSIRKHFVHY